MENKGLDVTSWSERPTLILSNRPRALPQPHANRCSEVGISADWLVGMSDPAYTWRDLNWELIGVIAADLACWAAILWWIFR